MSAPWKFLPCPNCCGCVCYQDSVQNIDMADNYEVRSGSWLLGSALMPNCNIQTADSNALLINKNACGGDTPKFGYTAIVSMGVWQPGRDSSVPTATTTTISTSRAPTLRTRRPTLVRPR